VHEPDPFRSTSRDGRTLLQLSGHTHGGQCRVPLLGFAPVLVDYGRRFTSGHYRLGESHLYVSRGLGTVGLEVRFACRPEVAIITLARSA
jgi:predicted MPP superfamily phosphohydrolase